MFIPFSSVCGCLTCVCEVLTPGWLTRGKCPHADCGMFTWIVLGFALTCGYFVAQQRINDLEGVVAYSEPDWCFGGQL